MSSDSDSDAAPPDERLSAMLARMHEPKPNLAARYLPRKDAQFDDLVFESDTVQYDLYSYQIERLSKLEETHKEALSGKRHRTALEMAKIQSPIAFVPGEVLLHVFQEYMSDIPALSIPSDCIEDVNFAPWILGQVSQEWRRVSFSSSSLWKDVHIRCKMSPFGYNKERTEKQKDAVAYLLSRQIDLSKGHPLNISIDLHVVSRTYPKTLDILLPHRYRWQILRLIHSQDTAPDSMEEDELNWQLLPVMDPSIQATAQRIFLPSSVDPLEFSLLENFSISVDAETRLDIFSNNSFPSLTTYHHPKHLSPFPRGAPWSIITDLFFHVVSAEDLLYILPLLTHVRLFVVGYLELHGDIIPEGEVAVLPHLEELTVWIEWAPAMQAMTTPALKRLYIGDYQLGHGIDRSEDLQAVIDLMHRSSAPLSEFRMCLPVPPEPTLESLLSSMPGLTELKIYLYYGDIEDVDSAYFAHLTKALSARNHEGGFSVCPRLQKICIFNESAYIDDEDDEMAFLDMLEMRYDKFVDSNLISVEMTGLWELLKDGLEDDLERRITSLRSKGLDIQVSDP